MKTSEHFPKMHEGMCNLKGGSMDKFVLGKLSKMQMTPLLQDFSVTVFLKLGKGM